MNAGSGTRIEKSQPLGTTPEREGRRAVHPSREGGLTVRITNYGGIIVSILVPDAGARWVTSVWGSTPSTPT